MIAHWLTIAPDVLMALTTGQPVVALESTLICHGLPWPQNRDTAWECEDVIRAQGAVPATVAVVKGVPRVGLTRQEIENLAQTENVYKASRRDLSAAVGLGRTAATTVSATMALAHAAGVKVFATGGIGGVHRSTEQHIDVSADLVELSRTPVLVVCSGAKSILDLPNTLELLETLQVPVLGYRTQEFPAFYTRGLGLPVSAMVSNPQEAAAVFQAHVAMGSGGALLAQAIDDTLAIPAAEFEAALTIAEADAHKAKVTGANVTPYLLNRLADLTIGKTLAANRALIVNNARLAAEVAKACQPGF